MKNINIKLLAVFIAVTACFALVSCTSDGYGSDGYARTGEMIQNYDGMWSSINTESKDGFAPNGTMMKIEATGCVTWQKPNGEMQTGRFRMLNSEWMEVFYAGKTYRAEWWEDQAKGLITFNVNGLTKGTPFPFDGRFKRVQ